ncbi:MAG: hypothetical protein JFAIHJKO_00271 [Pyrinomonadaceae bacterium]|nr:hypothetical protein [Pyrinomonadaceae bacterium]
MRFEKQMLVVVNDRYDPVGQFPERYKIKRKDCKKEGLRNL